MKKSAMKTERREVYYSGRVQGVGFRFSVQQIAADLDVSGFVRNLPDGRVQLVAEGASDQLDRMLGEINRVMQTNIGKTDIVRDKAATGDFSGFAIRY